MLATIYASACCSSTSQTFYLPISLNSLDCEGVRLLSPRDSQITSKTSLHVSMISCRWRIRAQGGAWWRSCLLCCFRFQLISSGAQLGRSGICSISGSLVLPLSKCLVTRIARLVGSFREKEYPSLTVRACDGLSWDTPAKYINFREPRPRVCGRWKFVNVRL